MVNVSSKRAFSSSTNSRAFSRRDLLVIVAVAVLGAVVFWTLFEKVREKSRRIYCINNLQQVGLGFRTWALDHREKYPMVVSTNSGGSSEYVVTGDVFRHFQVMSNELSTSRILVCPSDSRKSAKTFERNFGNSNLSYFVCIVSNASAPQMFLSGDRNIQGGTKLPNGLLEIGTNDVIQWKPGMHKVDGNIGLADGSVQGFSNDSLQNGLRYSGDTNRFAIP